MSRFHVSFKKTDGRHMLLILVCINWLIPKDVLLVTLVFMLMMLWLL